MSIFKHCRGFVQKSLRSGMTPGRVLRIVFYTTDNENVRRYAENLIRKSVFGTGSSWSHIA